MTFLLEQAATRGQLLVFSGLLLFFFFFPPRRRNAISHGIACVSAEPRSFKCCLYLRRTHPFFFSSFLKLVRVPLPKPPPLAVASDPRRTLLRSLSLTREVIWPSKDSHKKKITSRRSAMCIPKPTIILQIGASSFFSEDYHRNYRDAQLRTVRLFPSIASLVPAQLLLLSCDHSPPRTPLFLPGTARFKLSYIAMTSSPCRDAHPTDLVSLDFKSSLSLPVPLEDPPFFPGR